MIHIPIIYNLIWFIITELKVWVLWIILQKNRFLQFTLFVNVCLRCFDINTIENNEEKVESDELQQWWEQPDRRERMQMNKFNINKKPWVLMNNAKVQGSVESHLGRWRDWPIFLYLSRSTRHILCHRCRALYFSPADNK